MIKAPGSTDVTITVFALDRLTNLGKTGLVAASLNAYFSRVETDNDVTATAITESDLSALTDAHSDGGWYEIDSTNMKGHYRFDLPDAVCASGAVEAVVSIQDAGDNNFIIMPTKIELRADPISVADILTTQMTESYATNGTAPTLAQSQFAIHQMLMQFAISGTSYTVKKLDNSTTAFVVTLDDATTPTSAVRT